MVPPLVYRLANYEFEILYAQMVHEGIQILRFLSFATCLMLIRRTTCWL